MVFPAGKFSDRALPPAASLKASVFGGYRPCEKASAAVETQPVDCDSTTTLLLSMASFERPCMGEFLVELEAEPEAVRYRLRKASP